MEASWGQIEDEEFRSIDEKIEKEILIKNAARTDDHRVINDQKICIRELKHKISAYPAFLLADP